MEKASKKILVTGGYGFIGSHVVRHLVKKYPNYQIINYDALTYAGNVENLKDIIDKPNYVAVIGDIRDNEQLKDVFKKFDITDVIHLAAESHVDRSMVNPTVFVETNVIGTVNLLNVAKEHWKGNYHGHIFLNMGTDEIFGALDNEDEPFNELTPLNPHSPYSTSKTAAVMFGKTYFEAYGLPVINLACGNAIGPNQFPEKLVPLVLDRLINGGTIPIYGQGEQKRDWTNVHDIADAIDLLIHKGTPGELYCIGGDAQVENRVIIHDLIIELSIQMANGNEEEEERLQNKYFDRIEFIKDPRGKSHDFRYDINHDKITARLGWKPKHTYNDSLIEVVSWYRNNQDWVNNVKTGEYKDWIDKYYSGK